MFKKIPYGVKVRVRGNDETGYVAEYAIHCSRFFPFMDDWCIIEGSHSTFELAQKASMHRYNRWINYFQCKEKEEKLKKRLKKTRVLWKHP